MGPKTKIKYSTIFHAKVQYFSHSVLKLEILRILLQFHALEKIEVFTYALKVSQCLKLHFMKISNMTVKLYCCKSNLLSELIVVNYWKCLALYDCVFSNIFFSWHYFLHCSNYNVVKNVASQNTELGFKILNTDKILFKLSYNLA